MGLLNKWLNGLARVSPAVGLFYLKDRKNRDELAITIEDVILPCLSDSSMTVQNVYNLLIQDPTISERKKQELSHGGTFHTDSDEAAFLALKDKLSNQKIVLIAPGKSSVTERKNIVAGIDNLRKVGPVSVIAVNALLKEYDGVYDTLFLTNNARYEYAKETRRELFDTVSKILLSSVKKEGDEKETVIGFERAIKRGWDHFDNAVICALRLLRKLEVKEVYIAGFDGFKQTYNESYADASLPTINPGKKWEELNEEIKEMFADVKAASPNMQIHFLTESLYEQ